MGPCSERLILGKIGYLNVLPIYFPLENGIVAHPFTIVSGTPAHLNGLMSQGALDLSVVSSIEYARHPERYFILPDLSISCLGPVRSVLLLSRIPFDELAGVTILASAQSHTSVGLLKVLLSQCYGIEAHLDAGNCMAASLQESPPAAMLTIGDEALRLRHDERFPFKWDLGIAWTDLTGLPFVFAVWVVQRTTLQKWTGNIGTAIQALLSAKSWGKTEINRICINAEQRGVLNFEELQDYYKCLNYDLGEGHRRGLERFYQHLVGIGVIEKCPRLDICSPLACVA